jgi:hypothetical protein
MKKIKILCHFLYESTSSKQVTAERAGVVSALLLSRLSDHGVSYRDCGELAHGPRALSDHSLSPPQNVAVTGTGAALRK